MSTVSCYALVVHLNHSNITWPQNTKSHRVWLSSMNFKPSALTNGWNLNSSAIEGLTGLSKSYYNMTINLKINQVLYNRIINSRLNGNIRLHRWCCPTILQFRSLKHNVVSLRCVIPVVCVTNEREESVVNQHN